MLGGKWNNDNIKDTILPEQNSSMDRQLVCHPSERKQQSPFYYEKAGWHWRTGGEWFNPLNCVSRNCETTHSVWVKLLDNNNQDTPTNPGQSPEPIIRDNSWGHENNSSKNDGTDNSNISFQVVATPPSSRCTNYSSRSSLDLQAFFLTNACLCCRLHTLTALRNINFLKTVLLWSPRNCDIKGN